ncbi:YoaK family protein [Leuconostoc carnosum]|uniref:YoaK family protein n=1 Tax=Leuconostoc carnosum TaxID=1252 RepID=UPI00345D04EB
MSEICTVHPIHERLPIALLLATNAGFVDAYTFQYHADRFASLQTGNIIQAGIFLARGQFLDALDFIIPIVFFLLGAAFNSVLKHNFKPGLLSTQQHSLLVESIGIIMVVLLSNHLSGTAFITLLSFFLAIQLDAFPKVQGLPFTSVMSTGNLRSVGANLVTFFYTKEPKARQNAGLFSLIILAFLFGALISAFLTNYFKELTLVVSSVVLITIFFIIHDHSK